MTKIWDFQVLRNNLTFYPVCKVLVGEDEEILGVHLLGNPASELIVQAGMMIEDRRKLSDWKKYVFPHPTVGEIFREL